MGGSSAAPADGPGIPPVGLDLLLPTPDDNPVTAHKIALGRRLFFDPRLSSNAEIACGSCHRPDLAFADTVRVSRGVHGRSGERNTPTLLNVGYARSLTWDGRSASLEQQVLLPIQNEQEMGARLEDVLALLRQDRKYIAEFRRAFGGEPTVLRLSHALATYLRYLRAGESEVDRFRAGETALSSQAYRGFLLFVGRAGCATCHTGPLLSDQRFHNTGVAWRDGRFADGGRGAITGSSSDSGAFRTPTLRNVAQTAPYMHDGSIATLEDVIDFYARGGVANPYLSADIRAVPLSADDRAALVAFLNALTSPHWTDGTSR